jgi:DNA-directed RNA polymerase specialized sigma24 family protein
VRNEVRAIIRERRTAVALGERDPSSREETAAEIVVSEEEQEVLVDRFRSRFSSALMAGQLELADFELLRRRASGTSVRQLAAEHGVSPGSMAVRLHRAQKKYRRFFEAESSEVPQGTRFAELLADALEEIADEI